jgi:hypothetical protein
MHTPKSLFTARRDAHAAFDQFWKSGLMRRDTAYAKLARLMGLPPERAHFSLFTVEQCEQVIVLLGAMRCGIDANQRRRADPKNCHASRVAFRLRRRRLREEEEEAAA